MLKDYVNFFLKVYLNRIKIWFEGGGGGGALSTQGLTEWWKSFQSIIYSRMGFSKTPGVYGVKLTFSEPGNSLTRHKQK